MRQWGRLGLWVLATAATTAIAYVAVTTAGSEVTDRPLTGVVVSSPSSTVTSLAPITTTTTSVATTDTLNPTATTAPWQQTTLNSAGGTIIVSHRPAEVRLESAVPAPGFAFEINDDGPTRVEVEFEAEDTRYRLRAEWTSAGFVTDIESDED